MKNQIKRTALIGVVLAVTSPCTSLSAVADPPDATASTETLPIVNPDHKPDIWGVYEVARCPDRFSLMMQGTEIHCVAVASDEGGQNVAKK